VGEDTTHGCPAYTAVALAPAYFPPAPHPAALALAMATADAAGCALILANDPDADRLAVAAWVPADPADAGLVRTPGAPGEWRVFTGNEIGALLAAWAWECHVAGGGTGKGERCGRESGSWLASGCVGLALTRLVVHPFAVPPLPSSPPKPLPLLTGAWMAVSAVSSKLVRAIAAAEGFGFKEVLTGFKWHGTAMAAAQAAGERVLFSFEEAIGFACGDVVRDKDGVGAAAVFAEMAQHLARTRGVSVVARLGEIYARYGHYVSANGYVIVDDPSKSAAIFARLRAGGSFVGRLPLPGGRGLAVTGIRDLTATPGCPRGWDSGAPGGLPSLPVSSSGNMVTLTFANRAEVTLRTSEWPG
jgi:phosphomannomutase